MWHHGCTATVLMHDKLHIKLHCSPVSLPQGQGYPLLPEQGKIQYYCISRQSPEAAERGDAQSRSTPRAILDPSPGLGHHLAPQVLAPPPPVGRAMGSTPFYVSPAWGAHICIQKHNNLITPSLLGRQGSLQSRSPTLHSLCTESPLPPTTTEHPPAQPCPSPPALRQPCLFAQGICSRGHLL